MGDEGIYIYTRKRFPKIDAFEFTDQKTLSTIEKEFIRLFGPGNITSSNTTSKVEPLNFKKDMIKVSQVNCDELIPDTFDFKKFVPESFTNSSA